MQAQKGITMPILVILATFGIIIYLLISSTFPFKDKLFSLLYPKPSSMATETLADISPPALTASPVSTSQINLSWDVTRGKEAVTGYEIYRDNTKVATVATPSFGDTGLESFTSYTYYVRAFDVSGNPSASSNAISVTTLPPDTTDGHIRGTVMAENSPLAGVRVSLKINVSTKTHLTDSKGIFNITNLPPGTYLLSYEKTGYFPQDSQISVEPDKTTSITIALNKK